MFSQNKEEEVVINYFKSYKGTFLDCGSNDGITLSNTHALALKGWQGVCIEPSPKAFQSLQDLYLQNDKIRCINVAVSNYLGKADFYDSGTHLNKGDLALLSSLDKEEIKRWGKTTTFDKIQVDVVDFKTLLNLSPYKTFDLISLDIEGAEILVLPQINLIELGCRCICIEHNSNSVNKDLFIRHCRDSGLSNTLLDNAENIILAK